MNDRSIRLRNNAWLANILFLSIAVAFSWYFASLRFAKPEWGPASLAEMMKGTANTPFQYRVLVPWTINWFTEHLLPLPGIGTPRGLAFLIEMLCTFLLVVAFRHYLGFFFKNVLTRTLLSLTLIMVLPFNFLLSRLYPFWLAYDMPSMLFIMLGLILIRQRRWPLYYALFLVATFNRETTCFLTLIYLVTAFGKDRIGRIAMHCAAQFVIWFSIKHALSVLYATNPGAGMGLNKLADNLRALRGVIPVEGLSYPTFQPGVFAIMASSMAFIWLIVIIYFRLIEDDFIRKACLVTPLFFLVMLKTGNLPEVRIYGDMIPVILPAFLLILKETMTSKVDHRGA